MSVTFLTNEDKTELEQKISKQSEAIEELKKNGTGTGNGVTTAQATSLWAILQKSAFTEVLTDEELNNFKTAWGISDSGEEEPDEPTEPDTPEVTLTSISATYTGGEVAVGTALTELTGITVTATYSDGTTKTVTDYTLSGTIAEGTNTITVTYSGKTATFTVVGVAESGGDVEPLYTFEDCEAEVNSSGNIQTGRLTVSNKNHVKCVNTSLYDQAQKWFFNMNISSLASNGVTTPTDTWFIIPSGATVKLCVKNLTQTGVEQARLGLNSHESIHSQWQFIGNPLGDKTEFTFTADSNKDIKCVYLDVYPALNTPFEIELDVELYVNEKRWI